MKEQEQHTDSFSSFSLLIGVGWLMMALQFAGIINIGWVPIWYYWGFLLVLYVGLWLFVGIISGIISAVQNHKE